eukprot:3902194-Pyramimonas_sp.AAC.1
MRGSMRVRGRMRREATLRQTYQGSNTGFRGVVPDRRPMVIINQPLIACLSPALGEATSWKLA